MNKTLSYIAPYSTCMMLGTMPISIILLALSYLVVTLAGAHNKGDGSVRCLVLAVSYSIEFSHSLKSHPTCCSNTAVKISWKETLKNKFLGFIDIKLP